METSANQLNTTAPTIRGGRNRRRHRADRNQRGDHGFPQSGAMNREPESHRAALNSAGPLARQEQNISSDRNSSAVSTEVSAPRARTRRSRGVHARAGANPRSQGSRGSLNNNTGHPVTQLSTAEVTSSLQPEAPVFIPGRSHQSKSRGYTPRPRRDSSLVSTAPDIATRTHDNIRNGFYECLICMNEVLSNSKIWSCKTCWKVFHLSCIKKWSNNEGSTLAQRPGEDQTSLRQWRCPGCNLPKDEIPSLYTCWCEKEVDPRPLGGLPPHSCGQSCSKTRNVPKDCPHACDKQCHAGPCPPCTYMGPEQNCFCGKNTSRRRCVETMYGQGWCCGEICGDLMPCGEHTCQRPCHEGLCGACDVAIDGRCYCGKESRMIICNDKEDERYSEVLEDDLRDSWTGVFRCEETCGRKFDCEEHRCQKLCHPQSLKPSHCPSSADVVLSCPCGKTSLKSMEYERESCRDIIPSCTKDCGKELSCGHTCMKLCHIGSCPPCSQSIGITCRCGRVATSTMCHQGSMEPPLCPRTCKALLNCGRHDCGEHCCPGERKSTERLASKRKLRTIGSSMRSIDENIEAEHICTRVCGRELKCGNHSCPELCHKGPCGTCREAVFEEISCHCGKTILTPPLPCGTKSPPCRFECERAKLCGHPQVQHNCHDNDTECPICPYLVQKPCMCGKKTLKNQKCWLSDVRCGEICGKKLRCGSHTCRKPCHRPGECEDSAQYCQQACGKEKKCCAHPCEERCHAPTACKEDRPCQSKLIITCECQHLKTETKCLASRTSDGNLTKTLKCDDECARLQRNHQLALALKIDSATHTDDHVPYSTQTMNLYQELSKWAHIQEREMRIFAADDGAKRLRFKPMPSQHREFLHSLAEDFGFDSEGLDPEPHRHVVVFKTPRFVKAPMKMLADCLRIRTAVVPASSTATANSRLEAPNDLFNGFLLISPRFGLTIDELRVDLAPALNTAPTLVFDIAFLPSEEIILKAKPSSPTTTISPPSLETAVKSLKSNVANAIAVRNLASSISLCAIDGSLNILRKENDQRNGESGWSQVAAKAAAPRTIAKPEGWGNKSSFMVLGRKKRFVESKDEVVDDWEKAMNDEERENQSADSQDEVIEDVVSGLVPSLD